MKCETKKEMIDHCEKYQCNACPIANKCSIFEQLFSYLSEEVKKVPIKYRFDKEKKEVFEFDKDVNAFFFCGSYKAFRIKSCMTDIEKINRVTAILYAVYGD